MYAQNSEAKGLTRPLVRSAATVLDVVSRSAGRAADRLRVDAAVRGVRPVTVRPLSRVEATDQLLAGHYVHNVWRVQ